MQNPKVWPDPGPQNEKEFVEWMQRTLKMTRAELRLELKKIQWRKRNRNLADNDKPVL